MRQGLCSVISNDAGTEMANKKKCIEVCNGSCGTSSEVRRPKRANGVSRDLGNTISSQ